MGNTSAELFFKWPMYTIKEIKYYTIRNVKAMYNYRKVTYEKMIINRRLK